MSQIPMPDGHLELTGSLIAAAMRHLVDEPSLPPNKLTTSAMREVTANGQPAGRHDWNTTMGSLLKAGWVLRTDTAVTATAAGLDAFDQYGDSAPLAVAALERAAVWEERKAVLVDAPLPPFDSALANHAVMPWQPDERAVRQASTPFMSALRDGTSVFTPGTPIWTSGVLGEIAERLRSEDLGPESFWVKLHRQFDGSSEPVRQGLAELLAWIALPLADLTADRKRAWAAELLMTLGRPPSLPLDVDVAFEGGVYRGGLAFRTHLYRSMEVVASICQAAALLTDRDRAALVDDAWAWRDLIEANWKNSRAAGNSLKFLGHPQTFAPIVSDPDKRSIAGAFATQTPVDIDRALFDITLRLQQEHQGPIDFYVPPLVERWRPVQEALATEPVAQAWLLRGSAVQGSNLVPTWLEESIMSLPASHLKRLPVPVDIATLRGIINSGYQHLGAGERRELVETYFTFLTAVDAGDLVATVAQDTLHIGEVGEGDPELTAASTPTRLRRPVTWLTPPEGIALADVPETVAAKVRTQRDLVDVTDIRDALLALAAVKDEPELDVVVPDADDVLSAKLFIDRSWLQDVIDILEQKRQLVLYGPPGTGKTYLALALAEHLAPDTFTLVQFHPSTSYEDFFEGLRPVLNESSLIYEMKRGPLRRMVDDARKNPAVPYVLVIDEINRANLPKVFGELYFLLEYRNRGIELLYSPGEQFVLPRKVFIIGTMNTADRSIALVDTAMRRRFAFVELHPDREPTQSMFRKWCACLGSDLPLRLLEALNSDIADREMRLGPSYFMDKHIMDPAVLERIWRTQVLPLLAENDAGLRSADEVEAAYSLTGYLQRIGATPEEQQGT